MAPRKLDSVSWKKGHKDSLWTIRKPDAAPLLRYDLQWQLLHDIFSDRTMRFTAPVDSNGPPAEPIYLNFDQLYLEAILSSMKTTQSVRTKLIENPAFAVNFCKIALLINIGRINTTLAFYPSMKTALRTYHPVPSLQQNDETSKRDLSDAPRIKGILKASLLDWEVKQQPTCLQDIAKKLISPELTRGPPTTVITCIFHLFNEAIWATDKYFQGCDLLDIFYPSDLPSAPRAQAFLTLMHHLLEDKSFINDFGTQSSAGPSFVQLSPPISFMLPPPVNKENIDTPEELAYVKEMQEVRQSVVKTVPAYQKREEELNLKNAARKAETQGDEGAAPASKRQRSGKARSFAAVQRSMALAGHVPEILPPGWETEDWSSGLSTKSSLPLTWSKIRRDMEMNRDPDYDSDEEEAWSYDLLLRRKLLTIINPRTELRGPVTDIKEHEEWVRRKQQGYVPEEEDTETVVGAKAEELEAEDGDDE